LEFSTSGVRGLALKVYRVFVAAIAKEHQILAAEVAAVSKGLGRVTAGFTNTNGLGFVREVNIHAAIKDVERTLPEAFVTVALAVAHNATFNLVDLLEAAIDHDRGENLAANASSAVGDDWFVLEVVILATFQFSDEVVGGLNIWNYRVFELANLGFEGVTAIKKDHVIATLFDQLIYLVRL
jgi:hypothetical protein